MGFPGGACGKEPTRQCRRHKERVFSPWVEEILWRRDWPPIPVCLPGDARGQRSLAGYNPKDRKEPDTAEARQPTGTVISTYI